MRGGVKTVRVKVTLPEHIFQKVQERAVERGFLNVGEYIRHLIRRDLGE